MYHMDLLTKKGVFVMSGFRLIANGKEWSISGK